MHIHNHNIYYSDVPTYKKSPITLKLTIMNNIAQCACISRCIIPIIITI